MSCHVLCSSPAKQLLNDLKLTTFKLISTLVYCYSAETEMIENIIDGQNTC